ncbi:MAG: hypothetical protein Q6363_009800 [Candidatus Njordarchaeota archaeon]
MEKEELIIKIRGTKEDLIDFVKWLLVMYAKTCKKRGGFPTFPTSYIASGCGVTCYGVEEMRGMVIKSETIATWLRSSEGRKFIKQLQKE